MGEHVFGDLARGFRNVTVSRKRALQILGAALAVAAPVHRPQAAEAQTRRKPLAFVWATVTINAANPTTFTWQITGALAHPGSNYATTFVSNRGIAATLSADKVRANIVPHLKTFAASNIQQNKGVVVPKDRIAVTLV